MEYLYDRARVPGRPARGARTPISAAGQARDRDRRRRHRRGLRRPRAPRGRGVGHADRAARRAAARAPRRPHAVAALADEAAHARYALKEGGERDFAISTTALTGNGRRRADPLGAEHAASRRSTRSRAPRSRIRRELVLLAMGFLSPEQPLLEALGRRARRARQRASAGAYATSAPGVFAAGDARRGQSLIVWAINEGRQCARVADRYLRGLPGGDPARGVRGRVRALRLAGPGRRPAADRRRRMTRSSCG